MSLVDKIKETSDKVGNGISGVAGAIGGSQIPEFISQYANILYGHVKEAAHNVAGWKTIADKAVGGSIDKLVDIYHSSPVNAIVETGKKCASDVFRYDWLKDAYDSIAHSSIITKPFEFVTHLDFGIVKETLSNYVPSIPLSVEGAVYSVLGLGAGIGLYNGAKILAKKREAWGLKILAI